MKTILVIDMPSMCKECPLCYDDCICDIIGDVTDDDSVDMRCPLKPLPQKKELEESGNSLIDDCKEYYSDGWNACIDEITGEQNE